MLKPRKMISLSESVLIKVYVCVWVNVCKVALLIHDINQLIMM